MGMWEFLNKDIWHVQISSLPKWKAFGYRFLRIMMLTLQGFTKSQISLGASALTYYSTLSVVPILALLIGVARGFLFEKSLENWLTTHFQEQKEMILKIIGFATQSLESANGGVIAGIGVALLLWTAIRILSYIELVMNQVWEVKETRSLAKRFTDYMALLFLAPILILVSSGLTGYMSAFVSTVNKQGFLGDYATPVLVTLLTLISLFLTSLLFTFLYIFMPNTRVRFVPALCAGIFAAVVYQVLQWLYFYFQIGVASYNAIYGTFAAIPLFLIWLNLSWIVIILGAKVCFAIQNVDAYEFITDVHLSHRFRLICSIRITHFCLKRFIREQTPATAVELSNSLSIPLLLTNHLLFELVAAGLLVIMKREDGEEAYQLGKSPETLTVKRVMEMFNENGEVIPLHPSPEITTILKCLEKFGVAIEASDGNLLLKDI